MIPHASRILTLIGGRSDGVMQIGEVVGLGGRWNQERAWAPPMLTPKRGEMLDGSSERDWKAPDLSMRPAPPVARFTDGHLRGLDDLKAGDLVVYYNARVYDHFSHDGTDILVYPGNWIVGVVTEALLSEAPELRNYDQADI